MDDFKLIQGNGNPEVDKKELEQLQAGNAGKLYPVLRDGNWPGITHGAIYKTYIGAAQNPKVVIAIANDMPDNLIFVPFEGHSVDALNAMYEEAYANLYDIEIKYEKFEYNGHLEINACGNDFSSELVLRDDFLMDLHEVIGSESINIAIPRRGYFYAIASETSRDLYNDFIDNYEMVYDNEEIGKPQVYKGVFMVKNGRIVSAGELEKYDE